MRRSPPLSPGAPDTVYMVLDDFGELGKCYRETDPEAADLETVTRLLLTGEFQNPQKVIAFSLDEGWVRDESAVVARNMQRLSDMEGTPLSEIAISFIDQHLVTSLQPPLPFPIRNR